MKKTIIININGLVFNIDEDAYEKIQSYLDTLKHYFGSKPEATEIIEDIEARIAELFQPRVSEVKQSINVEDIEEIIGILGKPEDIAGANDENYEASPEVHDTPSRKASRRLYRDPNHAIFGGVCSGLGAYFAIDPLVFRLIFIVLLFGGGISFIIYVILWIAVPMAKTTAQKLEMRGENVTINNIERTFREEYQQVKKNLSRLESQSFWYKIRNFLDEVFMLLGNFLRVAWTVFKFSFGLLLIIGSLAFIAGMFGIFYTNNFIFNEITGDQFTSLKEFLTCIIDPMSADILLVLFLIIIALPIAGLIYAGLKLMIRFKAKDRWVILSLAILWVIAIISFGILIFDEVNNFRLDNETKEIVSLTNPHNNILYVTAPGSAAVNYRHLSHSNWFNITTTGKSKDIYSVTKIDIEKSNSTNPEIEITREARGKNRDEALEAAKQIKIDFKQNDSILNINPTFRLDNDQQWKFQTIKVVLRLPVGMKVHLNENTEYLLDNIENVNNYWRWDMAGKTWLMTDDGLSEVKKEK